MPHIPSNAGHVLIPQSSSSPLESDLYFDDISRAQPGSPGYFTDLPAGPPSSGSSKSRNPVGPPGLKPIVGSPGSNKQSEEVQGPVAPLETLDVDDNRGKAVLEMI